LPPAAVRGREARRAGLTARPRAEIAAFGHGIAHLGAALAPRRAALARSSASALLGGTDVLVTLVGATVGVLPAAGADDGALARRARAVVAAERATFLRLRARRPHGRAEVETFSLGSVGLTSSAAARAPRRARRAGAAARAGRQAATALAPARATRFLLRALRAVGLACCAFGARGTGVARCVVTERGPQVDVLRAARDAGARPEEREEGGSGARAHGSSTPMRRPACSCREGTSNTGGPPTW